MGVSYSQTRNIARTRIARADVDAQIADMLAEASEVAPDSGDCEWAAFQADQAAEDMAFFARHGYMPDWGYERWLEKCVERGEYVC